MNWTISLRKMRRHWRRTLFGSWEQPAIPISWSLWMPSSRTLSSISWLNVFVLYSRSCQSGHLKACKKRKIGFFGVCIESLFVSRIQRSSHFSHFQSQIALTFLNDACHSTHGKLTTSSIFISPSGEWKLGGLELTSNPKEENSVLYVRDR